MPPQKPPKEEMAKVLDSFAADFIDDDSDALVVDRSTLENYATCPRKARYIELGVVNNHSLIAAAGEAAHDAFSEAVTYYVETHGEIQLQELIQTVEYKLNDSRPDIQPDAIRAARPSIWPWSRFIASINPQNILRYDGGKGSKSGQLAWDVESVKARITSEVDLLYSGPSKECLHELDYKSGHKPWTASDVANSFQFQLHAWLIFHNYPDLQGLYVSVWATRVNRQTYRVEFTRDQLPAISARVSMALREWYFHRTHAPDKAPAWPAAEKCRICPAAALCPQAGAEARELAANPGAYVDLMHVYSTALDQMKKAASSHVEATGADIVSPSGIAFGIGKPKTARKQPKALYTTKPSDSDDGESEE